MACGAGGTATVYALVRADRTATDGNRSWIFVGNAVFVLFGLAQWALVVFPDVPPSCRKRRRSITIIGRVPGSTSASSVLQEGLTNGIKHGGARRFALTLDAEGGFVRFALRNDGAPYAAVPHGFGLSTLRERIAKLDGTLYIAPDGDRGASLELRFPVE